MKKPVIIIPAFNPDGPVLLDLVRQVSDFDIEQLIVVNDGSRSDCDDTFMAIETVERATVLYHRDNQGKGAALKTAFKYVLNSKLSGLSVVTMDADGQHHPEDVARVLKRSLLNPDSFILGVRRFSSHVPLRSLFGNKITHLLFRGLTGHSVSDTQTGLRAIPFKQLEKIVRLDSARYAYELEMLLTMVQQEADLIEVPIQTIYENNNATSSFRPIADSILVYRTMMQWWLKSRLIEVLKYSLSGIFSTIADFGTYIMLVSFSCGFVSASIAARVLSILIHFSSNRYFTFSHKDRPDWPEVGRYLLVVLFNLVSSIGLIYLFVRYGGVGEVWAKVFAQLILFFATYTLLNGFVFLKSKTTRYIEPDIGKADSGKKAPGLVRNEDGCTEIES